jgi:hypothetical protein
VETADHVIQILKQSVSDAVLEVSSFGRAGGVVFPLAWVKPSRIVECARALSDQGGFTQLENFSAMQVEDDVLFTYFAKNPETLETALLRVSLEVKAERWLELASVAEVWPMARPLRRRDRKAFRSEDSWRRSE